jgi:hypothetical protein
MGSKAPVFIAAPHSHCESNIRDCDTVAAIAVDALLAADEKTRLIARPPHMADALRADGDYNRPETDNTPWREALRKKLANARLVLETHSFPGNHPTFAVWGGADLVLFESPANHAWIKQFAADVRASVPTATVITAIPWHPVAISDDCSRAKVDHVLVEFNEVMPRANIGPLARAVLYAAERRLRQPIGGNGSKNRAMFVAALVLVVLLAIVATASTSDSFVTQAFWPLHQSIFDRRGGLDYAFH